MLTVYKYGFSEPVAPKPVPQTNWLMWALVAGAGYWGWKKGWFKGLAAKVGKAAPSLPRPAAIPRSTPAPMGGGE